MSDNEAIEEPEIKVLKKVRKYETEEERIQAKKESNKKARKKYRQTHPEKTREYIRNYMAKTKEKREFKDALLTLICEKLRTDYPEVLKEILLELGISELEI